MTFSFQCYNCYKFSDKMFERVANSGTLTNRQGFLDGVIEACIIFHRNSNITHGLLVIWSSRFFQEKVIKKLTLIDLNHLLPDDSALISITSFQSS